MHHFWLYTWKLGYATSCVTFHSVSLFTIFKLKQRRHCSLSVLSYKGTHLSSRPAFSPVILLLLTHFEEPLLLSLTSFTRFNFRWALVFLVASLHVLTTLLYSRTQTPFPYSVDFFFFLLFEFFHELLPHPCGSPGTFARFLTLQDAPVLEVVMFECQTALLGPLTCQHSHPWDTSK